MPDTIGVLNNQEKHMLMTIAIILAVLWLLGVVVVHVSGGLIHILLVIALVVFIYNMLTGRKSA